MARSGSFSPPCTLLPRAQKTLRICCLIHPCTNKFLFVHIQCMHAYMTSERRGEDRELEKEKEEMK
jgi:hypothetical protein